ncbi:hypothetical protein [Alishewanella longhuensis]
MSALFSRTFLLAVVLSLTACASSEQAKQQAEQIPVNQAPVYDDRRSVRAG